MPSIHILSAVEKINCENLKPKFNGEVIAKSLKVAQNGDQNGGIRHLTNDQTRSNLHDWVNFASSH